MVGYSLKHHIFYSLYCMDSRKLFMYKVIHREYKIFCVNEKIHTKKEVPSVE